MKILIVGSGGREHALAWKCARSPLAEKVYAAPGNVGMAGVAECVALDVEDVDGLAGFAARQEIDMTIVGPEVPLTMGIADAFREKGLKVFGPVAAAARLEGDKTFAKKFMADNGIPTAAYAVFTEAEPAREYIRQQGAPIVLKASGLAAGKGVLVCMTEEEAMAGIDKIMVEREFGAAGDQVVIEEFMEGEEASILAVSDGTFVKTLVSSQDHKRAYDGDAGPNTGGMGAYAPAPVVTPELEKEIMDRVLRPAVDGMKKAGSPYVGILYAGLMITAEGPKVVEFNCRFGDPETQPVLSLLESDLVPIMAAACDGTLEKTDVVNDAGASVCVVMASGGYPGSYEKGKPISGLDDAGAMDGVVVFHAGTAAGDGAVVTAGGRVLGVTARGDDIKTAIATAYAAVEKISFEGAHVRSDIGYRALERLK